MSLPDLDNLSTIGVDEAKKLLVLNRDLLHPNLYIVPVMDQLMVRPPKEFDALSVHLPAIGVDPDIAIPIADELLRRQLRFEETRTATGFEDESRNARPIAGYTVWDRGGELIVSAFNQQIMGSGVMGVNYECIPLRGLPTEAFPPNLRNEPMMALLSHDKGAMWWAVLGKGKSDAERILRIDPALRTPNDRKLLEAVFRTINLDTIMGKLFPLKYGPWESWPKVNAIGS